MKIRLKERQTASASIAAGALLLPGALLAFLIDFWAGYQNFLEKEPDWAGYVEYAEKQRRAE